MSNGARHLLSQSLTERVDKQRGGSLTRDELVDCALTNLETEPETRLKEAAAYLKVYGNCDVEFVNGVLSVNGEEAYYPAVREALQKIVADHH